MTRERNYDMKRYTHVFMNGVRTITLTPYYNSATEWNVIGRHCMFDRTGHDHLSVIARTLVPGHEAIKNKRSTIK